MQSDPKMEFWVLTMMVTIHFFTENFSRFLKLDILKMSIFEKLYDFLFKKNKILLDSTFLFRYIVPYKITILSIIKRSIYPILFVRCSVPLVPWGSEATHRDPFNRPLHETHSVYNIV